MLRSLVLLLLLSSASAQPMPDVIWDRSGLDDSSQYGGRINSLGDQNNDGFNDWMITAYGAGGYVELFHGGNPPSNIPYRRFTTGDTLFAVGFGDGLGDINGDSIEDYQIVIWPVEEEGLTTLIFFWGGDTVPDFIRFGGYADYFARMGDFNGDGFDDLFLRTLSGYGQIMFGGNPMNLEPDWEVHDDPPGSYSSLPWAYGDLNGDNFADILSYNQEQGQRVWFGSANPDTHLIVVGDFQNTTSFRNIILDLNNDGRDDFLVPHSESIDVYFGNESLSGQPDYILNWPAPCTPGDLFSAGDFNNDNHNDLVAIGHNCTSGWGRLGLYLGYRWLNPNPVFQIVGRGWQNLIGIWTACGLGDVNGDNIDDIAIGAFNGDNDGFRGRAIVLAGSEDYIVPVNGSHPELPDELSISVYPNPFNSETTFEFQLPLFATEVELKIYNTLGQQVKQITLFANSPTLKHHFNGNDLATGVYFLQAQTGDFFATMKLMVLK